MYTVYATYRNSDMNEGRGPMVMDKVFTEERDAQEYINQQPGVFGRHPEHGWQNSGLSDWTVKSLIILEHLEDGEEYARQQTLERAYSKLTPKERSVLEQHVRTTQLG
jgi:hypothetical protein